MGRVAAVGGVGRVQERGSLSLSLEDGGQPLEGATPGGSPQPNEEPVEKSEQQSASCGACSSSATIAIEVDQRWFSATKPSFSVGHPRLSTTASKLPAVPPRPRPQCRHPSRPLRPCWEPRVCVGSEAAPDWSWEKQ